MNSSDFNTISPYFLREALIHQPKQVILTASEVNHHWHTALSDPTFFRAWLARNGISFTSRVRDLAVRHFFINYAFSNFEEIQPALDKIFSKDTPIHIGIFCHNTEIETSFQFHENTMTLEKFDPTSQAYHFLILPYTSIPQVPHIVIANRKWNHRKLLITMNGDEEVAKIRTAILNHLGMQ